MNKDTESITNTKLLKDRTLKQQTHIKVFQAYTEHVQNVDHILNNKASLKTFQKFKNMSILLDNDEIKILIDKI